MLLAFTDKTRVSVEEPKTIIWIYEMRIFIYIYRYQIQRTQTNFVITLI